MRGKFLSIFALIFLFLIAIVTASTFIDNQESDFNSGTYNWTFYNSSGFIQLNESRLNGTFTSQIFNSGEISKWNNISWFTEVPYNQELPNNRSVETGDFLRGMNMTGNVALWHLDEDSPDSVIDSSGNGYEGSGDAIPSNGKINGGFSFQDSSLTFSNVNLPSPNKLTISIWIKREGTAPYGQTLIADGGQSVSSGFLWVYLLGSSNSLYYQYLADGSIVSDLLSANINLDGSWHMLTIVADYSEEQLITYYDGLEIYSDAMASGAVAPDSQNIYLGRYTPTHSYAFNGLLDEVAIWNRSLSAQEIKDIYKRGALRLNLSVQSCNDLNCEGESWTNVGNNLTSPQNLSENDNQYFQYKLDFETDNQSFTPELYNVSLNYYAYPTIGLISPENSVEREGPEQTFSCNATSNTGNLANISLYHNATGTWHLNATNEVSGTENETSFTVSGLPYTTFVWSCLATDSNGLSRFADSNFTLTTIADATDPEINSYEITSSLTSGETATIRANVTDSSTISLVWFTINNTDGTLTNYTMSQEGSTDFYNTTFEVGKAGTWYYKIYANDSYSNTNDTMEWQDFSISTPSTTTENEIYPTYALPSSSIVITADLTATDLLKEVNATLNVPSGFEFPFTSYPQTQEIGNFSALQTQTARWFVYLPNTETTHTFNVTWTDKYNNSFQGDNKEIIVAYDSTNFTNTTNVNTISFPELEAGDVLESEIQVRDINGDFVNASSIKISLYDPNNNLIVDSVNYVSQLGTGRYFYNYTTPSAPTGQWIIYVNVTRNGNSFIDREYFRLTGGPFDIRDIEVTDSIVPSLGISTVLENMGNGVTDIVVDWNLTRMDTGELLDSGQDTIGVTNEVIHTITPETNYVGEVKITFLGTWSSTEKAGALETFTITSATSSEGGDTGGNSGSGGGSITGRVTEEVVCNLPYIRYGIECCLDKDNNSICDKDEVTKKSGLEGSKNIKEDTQKEDFSIYGDINQIKKKIHPFSSSLKGIISSNKIYGLIVLGALIFIGAVFTFIRFLLNEKSKDVTRLKSMKSIKVYGSDGNKIGKIKEIYLEDKRAKIYGWLIKVDKNISREIKKKEVLIKHKHVESIKNIMIIDKRVSEKLRKY